MTIKKWVAYRNEEVCGVFDNRKEAVKWLKGLLRQTLDDFKNQDKNDTYNYQIEIPRIRIKSVKQREICLGL